VRVCVLREYLKSSNTLKTLLLAGPALVISNSFVDADVFNISLHSHLNVLVVSHCKACKAGKGGKVQFQQDGWWMGLARAEGRSLWSQTSGSYVIHESSGGEIF
jgi:hypothetical protein